MSDLIDIAVPAIAAAFAVYGQAVVEHAAGTAADRTVALGLRLIAVLRRVPAARARLDHAVAASASSEADATAGIAEAVREALVDPGTSAEIAALLGLHASAIGDGAVAVNQNMGVISTGESFRYRG